jgi:hypothetical protein
VNKESTADVEVFPDCESTTQMLIWKNIRIHGFGSRGRIAIYLELP